MNSDLKLVEADAANHLKDAELFEFPEAMARTTDMVGDCRTDLKVAKGLWDLIAVVHATFKAWNATLWNDLNTGAMEDETKSLTKMLRALPKGARDFDAYAGLDTAIKNFLVALPAVADLRSPSMRDRHWTQLMEITGVHFEIGASFALSDLLSLQLHQYVDDVGEVVDRALKEDKMEQALDKLATTWSTLEFEFEQVVLPPLSRPPEPARPPLPHSPPHTPPPSPSLTPTLPSHPSCLLPAPPFSPLCPLLAAQYRDKDVHLLKMKEEDFETLEDNQLVVQGMMASKYLATFEEQVTGWQKKLGNVSEVLSQMSEVQRKWAYLETLFIGSEEVKKELPESARRFVSIDGSFQKACKAIHATKNAVGASNAEGLMETLEEMAKGLELCEKDLADFLESKRRVFPRFYFCSTNMLLDILSNGNRPWVVAQHINAMFQGIKELGLPEGGSSVEKLVSNEGEEVPLKGGALKLAGKVENYLGELIGAIRKELLAQITAAVGDYAKRERKEWLFDHVAQLVIVCTQLFWTSQTEAAFDEMQRGEPSGLKDYSTKQIDALGDLIKLVQGDLERLQRRKIMNMITMETHSRDINLGMIAEGHDSKDCFRWVSQLKTRFQKRGGDREEDVHIDICDASFRYSFEYLGNASRLVITPLTDRIYVTATQACHLVLGCAPAGPAGTGKTETTKDLSSALGKAVYVFNCGPEMDYRTMGDIFKGLASSGSWGCFDEFNRLVPEVLSVCSVQYKTVLDAIRAKQPHFKYEGVEYVLHEQGCMSFITMNPGYLGRAELPESLKVLFRPVTVMVPDMRMIMENMLMAEGYQEANTLAKKFFTLYSLLQDLLSPQMHYDWGLRAIKSVLVQVLIPLPVAHLRHDSSHHYSPFPLSSLLSPLASRPSSRPSSRLSPLSSRISPRISSRAHATPALPPHRPASSSAASPTRARRGC